MRVSTRVSTSLLALVLAGPLSWAGVGAAPPLSAARAVQASVQAAAQSAPSTERAAQAGAVAPADRPGYTLSAAEEAFLEDLSKRAFLYFWEQADPALGIVRDRARTDGSPPDAGHRNIGSIAATGFGLTALCIAAERDWRPRPVLIDRARATLMFFAERQEHKNGWFYHWINLRSGKREWKSEISSIDTALLLAGVLTARQCFGDDPGIVRAAETIYRRVDFPWMLNGHATLLSHGWHPETGFIKNRWDAFSEAMVLYILGAGSPKRPLPKPAESWAAWARPSFTYDGLTYVHTVPPLFLHQYSHAWIPFQQWRDPVPPQADWFENSVLATRAQQRFFSSLSSEFPGYSSTIWGVTASDSRKGYKAWGGPPRDPAIDGTVVPCAAAGSLMFTPELSLAALRAMHARFGDRIYGRYGFADAFHPTEPWVDLDVIGIDVGITLLSAENLRSGRVWRWFLANDEIVQGLKQAGLTPRS